MTVRPKSAQMLALVQPDESDRDEALAARVRAGDVEAYGTLVQRYLPRAFAVAWRILRHREDAEDLVQEAFLVALDRIESYDPTRPFAPWFLRIVTNRALNARESRAVRDTDVMPDDVVSPDESPDREVERRDVGTRVRAAMQTLPERTRLVVELFELEGYSAAEISQMLGMSTGTVRWHAHSGRAALRDALAGEQVGHNRASRQDGLRSQHDDETRDATRHTAREVNDGR